MTDPLLSRATVSGNEKLIIEARAMIDPEHRFWHTEVERTDMIRRLIDALEETENDRNRLLGERFSFPLPPKKGGPQQDSGLTARSERADVESRKL